MTYVCPVCGYDQLPEPAANFIICPSCGTEFENDDYFATHEELRSRWIASGANWWSTYQRAPRNWSAAEQLLRARFELTEEDLASIGDTSLVPFMEVELILTNTTLDVDGSHTHQQGLFLRPNYTGHLFTMSASAFSV